MRLSLLFIFLAGTCWAERLPIKAWTSADGLAHDHINRIRRDSRGFVWICTDEGLSRFEGYAFTSYTTADGLPHPHVNDLLETRSGTYWIATDGGVCRFNPKGSRMGASSKKKAGAADERMFVVLEGGASAGSRVINTLAEDESGVVWCGANDGLYRLDASRPEAKLESVDLALPRKTREAQINAILVDRTSTLWLGASSGLYRWKKSGPAEWYMLKAPGLRVEPTFLEDDHGRQAGVGQGVNRLLEDRDGGIWVASRYAGLFRVRVRDRGEPGVEWFGPRIFRLPHQDIRSLLLSPGGALWLGSVGGLSKLILGASPGGRGQLVNYTTANGLSDSEIYEVADGGDGSLWVGTHHAGIMKIAGQGFTTYGEADHFQPSSFNSILETHDGALCLTGGDYYHRFIQRFDGNRFVSIWPQLPKRVFAFGWGWQQTTFQDHAGEWWVATAKGLFRFPKVTHFEALAWTAPKRVYTVRDGLARDDISRLYEDSHGDIWIATNIRTHPISRWERSTDKIRTFSETGLPDDKLATAFREDGSGNLWIGYENNGGLIRHRNGRFWVFRSADGVPAGSIHAIHLDQKNRLWIASSEGGLARLDDPSSDRPRFIRYTTAEGLSSNEIWSITEDASGRIYASTGRALDRLNPESGAETRVIHYTEADGLAKGGLRVSLRDRRGTLWFVTTRGISRMEPSPEKPSPPRFVLLDGLRIAGVKHPVSEIGETEIGPLELPPDRNDVQISYVGLDANLGGKLLYQYRLQGEEEWSSLTDQRSINYANLAPGAYVFEVRAVNPYGLASASPARLVFRIQRPVWQRAWFILMAVFSVGALIYSAHLYHVKRAVALEQVRTRIAMDLHDDIGSGLSRMTILGEVVRRDIGAAHPQSAQLLAGMAETARGLVDSLGDIVWSIDPHKDDVSDLVVRVRQLAFDLFGAASVEWRLEAPDSRGVKLGADERRHVFLILKEALTNIVKHSGCTQAQIAIRTDGECLRVEVRDNGLGLQANEAGDMSRAGNGLSNMKMRATQLGGRCAIQPAPSGGTVVSLVFPIKR